MKRKANSAGKPAPKPKLTKPTPEPKALPRGRRAASTSAAPPGKRPAKGKSASQPAAPAAPAKPGRTPGAPKKPSKRAVELPAILFEGDSPSLPAVSGPGQRYALGPVPPPARSEPREETGELPEAYGTKRLFVTARDPHWLYAHWDLTSTQLRTYNARSADKHLVLRVYADQPGGAPAAEVHVHPESRNWFVHVERARTRYYGELGYYAKVGGRWVGICASGSTLTPPDAMSPDTSVHFATIPVDTPFEMLVALIKSAARENVPLAEAILQLQREGFPGLPPLGQWSTMEWTAEQERALAQAVQHSLTMDNIRRIWIGSLEITELLRRKLAEQRGSAALAEFGMVASPSAGWGSISSPFGEAERPRGFWFMVNAELIVYGATEPNARVSLCGRPITLRPDGTFSYRFALPDGLFKLPAVAVSAEGDDRRAAALEFSRSTAYTGEVGAHPQDPALKDPATTPLT